MDVKFLRSTEGKTRRAKAKKIFREQIGTKI
jgi:hypothetical protein